MEIKEVKIAKMEYNSKTQQYDVFIAPLEGVKPITITYQTTSDRSCVINE